MKIENNILYVILLFAAISFFSCNNASNNAENLSDIDTSIIIVENLEDLYNKYDTLKIKNCEQLLEMANDMYVAYFNSVDLAYSGNDKAKSDFLDFNIFKSRFDFIKDSLGKDCQTEINKWKVRFEDKEKLFSDKINTIINQDTLKYDYKQVGDSIYDNLDKQLEELESDLSTRLNTDEKK